MWSSIVIVLTAFLLVCGGQETLEDRIQTVFGAAPTGAVSNNSSAIPRAGFDVIVQPDPVVEVGIASTPDR